jgi:NAD(P)-dependent dehydrogenase (short-subunit alcohol dehydrogenase family)
VIVDVLAFGDAIPVSRWQSWATVSTSGDELRAKLPIWRVVGPADVAALAVHIMSNTALKGATYDIDGGQQLVC